MLARTSEQLDQSLLSSEPHQAKLQVSNPTHTKNFSKVANIPLYSLSLPPPLSHTHTLTLTHSRSLSLTHSLIRIHIQTTDGDDYVGGDYTVTFGTEANALACADIGIVVDNVFEDIENFDTNLLPGESTNVMVGPEDNTAVFIDDLGRFICTSTIIIHICFFMVGLGDVVNDTLIGDPLLTVPLPDDSLVAVPGVREASLCYEVHGRDNAWFNLLSDGCVSVNAHYFRFDNNFNFVDRIAIRAVDETGNCRNIMVDLDGCSTSIDGSPVTISTPYCQDGVFVRPSRQANRVRVSVPNCNETSNLVMWTYCQRNIELMDPFDMMTTYSVDMIKFVIARGSNLGASSHGIIGELHT